MIKHSSTFIYDRNGNVLWSGDYSSRLEAIEHLKQEYLTPSLGFVLGAKTRIDGTHLYTSKEILKKAIQLGFVETKFNSQATLTILPPAKIIERVVEKINNQHFKDIGATEVSFPTFFNVKAPGIRELTLSYANDNRMFRIESGDQGTTLSYAADPGLFLWLKDRVINDRALPLPIYSLCQVFRRYKGGELSGFPQLREFPMPDLHILTPKERAFSALLQNLKIATHNMKHLISPGWIFCMDITESLLEYLGDKFFELIKSVENIAVINILTKKPRYYDMKITFMMDAGDRSIMNYNMQWDEENPKRFNIKNQSNDDLVVIHGTMMHSWYKILPVFINNYLVKKEKVALPFDFSLIQTTIIPTEEDYIGRALKIYKKLSDIGIRCYLLDAQKNISKGIQKSNRLQSPFFIIVGEKEIESRKYKVQNTNDGSLIDLDTFISNFQEQGHNHAPLYENVTHTQEIFA